MLSKSLQVIKFGLVGVSSSLVYMAVIALLSMGLGYSNTPSVIIAYLVGTVVSYLGSGLFAFQTSMTGTNFSKFLVVVGLSFLANILVSEIMTTFGVSAVAIGATNVVLVGLFNYLAHKYWTFRE